jgi:hypothetical protein
MQCVTVGTSATFSYNPTLEEMKKYVAAKHGKTYDQYKDKHISKEEEVEAMETLLQLE